MTHTIHAVKQTLVLTIVTLSLILAGLFISQHLAHAESLPFTVQPIGKIYQPVGYFKFHAQPSKNYNLSLLISNTSNKNLTVDIQKLNALTSVYGNIQYVPAKQIPNAGLTDSKRAMATYLKGDGQITLGPKANKTLNFILSTPDSIHSGTILGGLSFREHKAASKQNVKGKKVVIYNQVERVIGIEADYNSLPAKVTASRPTVLSTPSAPYVMIHIKNESPSIVNHVKLNYTVSRAGKALFKGSSADFNMAPTTQISYPAPWAYKTFSDGLYHIDLNLTVNGNKVSKQYDFIVPKQNVVQYQKQTTPVKAIAVENNSTYFWLMLLGAVILGAAIAIVVVILLRKKDKGTSEKDSKAV